MTFISLLCYFIFMAFCTFVTSLFITFHSLLFPLLFKYLHLQYFDLGLYLNVIVQLYVSIFLLYSQT